MINLEFAKRIAGRAGKYASVSIPALALDVFVVFLCLTYFDFIYQIAVICGFLAGITFAYVFNYSWVFRGTRRGKLTGYGIFLLIDLCGLIIVTLGVTYLVEFHGVSVLIARIIMSVVFGLTSFLANTFLNFKLI